ncbi:hypothetical protein GCM10023149_34150 [Mucilaginibacter gynuensis]|uniref:Lipoprotein n=1 Tax=Mucilaginibacter gynuensis TaxID=1302236 RepID=A0ABP8GT50_9SPHI
MKKIALFLLLCCMGCAEKQANQTIQISMTNDHKTAKFTSLNGDVAHEIERDTTVNKWQNLLPVYRMPADTDLKDFQPPQPGVYKLVQNQVFFTPDTAFVTGQTYFVRFYRYSEGGTSWDMLSRKNKPGQHPYTDLIFKP